MSHRPTCLLILILILVVVAGCLPAGWARADFVTVAFTGQVTRANTARPELSGVVVGAPVVGSFTYDTSLVNTTPTNPNQGNHLAPRPVLPPLGIQFRVGGVTVSNDPTGGGAGKDLQFVVNDNLVFGQGGVPIAEDQFLVAAPPIVRTDTGSTLADPFPASSFLLLSLTDPTTTALSSTALPPSLDLNAFASRLIDVSLSRSSPTIGSDTFGVAINGVGPVPEPGSLALLGLGAAGLIVASRRVWVASASRPETR